MHEALTLDEILCLIISHCDRPVTAYRCALVSRAWSQHALALLWRGSLNSIRWFTPTLFEIRSANISSQRLQNYMTYARFVKIWCGSSNRDVQATLLSSAANLTAPHATSLFFDFPSDCISETIMYPLLVPTLRSIELYNGHFTNKFLLEIKSRCPLLQLLSMHSHPEFITLPDFVDFLHSMNQLQALTLLNFDISVTEDMLLHLLSRGNLEHLCLGKFARLSLDTLDKFPSPGIPPAASTLQSLTLYNAEGPALHRLLPMLKNLQRVSVGVHTPLDRPERDVLAPLAHCPKLRGVVLIISNMATVSIKSLITLVTRCPQLEHVEIGPSNPSTRIGMSLPTGTWERLISHMSRIEVFTLGLEICISTAQFALLAIHCPRLERLELLAHLEVAEMGAVAKPGAFKALEELSLLSFLSDESFETPTAIEDASHQAVPGLAEYMPRLNRYWLVGPRLGGVHHEDAVMALPSWPHRGSIGAFSHWY